MAMESVAKLSLPPPKSKANDEPLSLKSNKGGSLEERFVHHAVSFFVPFVIFVVKPSYLKSRLHAGADIQTRHAPGPRLWNSGIDPPPSSAQEPNDPSGARSSTVRAGDS